MWILEPARSSEPVPTPVVSPAISVQGLTGINLPLLLDPLYVCFFVEWQRTDDNQTVLDFCSHSSGEVFVKESHKYNLFNL